MLITDSALRLNPFTFPAINLSCTKMVQHIFTLFDDGSAAVADCADTSKELGENGEAAHKSKGLSSGI